MFVPVNTQPITVYLVESSEETRALVAGFLERSGRVRVVGTAADLTGAAEPIEEANPDVVVVDRFPGADALGGEHRVVLHATTVPDRTATELQRVGIHAIVFKEVGMLDQLVDTVERAAMNEIPLRSSAKDGGPAGHDAVRVDRGGEPAR